MKYLFVLLSVFISTLAIAQAPPPCPITDADGIYPLEGDDDYVAWTGAEEDIIIEGTTCTLKVLYCHRTIINFPCQDIDQTFNCTTYQRYVHEIIRSGDCTAFTDVELKNHATSWIFEQVPIPDQVPPCNFGMFPKLEGYSPACWRRTGEFPNYTYRSCPGAMCVKKCKICQDGNTVVHFNCVYLISEEPDCLNGNIEIECFHMPCPQSP